MSAGSGQLPNGPVVVAAEHRGGRLLPITRELAVCARRIADFLGAEVLIAVLGDRVVEIAQEAARTIGENAIAVQVEGLSWFHGEAHVKILAELLASRDVAVVVGGQTTSGMDWAPALAVDLNAAFVPGVEALEQDAEGLLLARAGVFGKAREVIRPLDTPWVITAAPGAFPAPAGDAAHSDQVEVISLEAPTCASRLIARETGAGQDAALTQAQVVVAAGRGIGKPENLDLIRRLAGLFTGSAVAGSRPVCDQGWLGYGSQVGLTGATVSPKLYIACGISGARQHTAGMQGSGFIVAISSDPAAAIFNVADVCIVEDLTVFIPALLDQA